MWFYRYFLLSLVLFSIMVFVDYTSLLHGTNRKYLRRWDTLDIDNDLIDDLLERYIEEKPYVYAIIALSTPPDRAHLDIVKSVGGRVVLGPWSRVFYGFTVLIPSSKLYLLRDSLLNIDVDHDGYSDLLFIEARRSYRLMMHYASRQVGVRPFVWNMGFYANYTGIALLDSGVDSDSPGLQVERIVGFDATGSGINPLSDEFGHGTGLAYVLSGVYSGGNISLSSNLVGPIPSTSGVGENYSIVYVSLPPVSVYTIDNVSIELWVYPYILTRDYMAWVFKAPGFSSFYHVSTDQLIPVTSNSSWIYTGFGKAYTVLKINTSMYGVGNYYIGIQHNYYEEVYVWFKVVYNKLLDSDGYPLSMGIAPGSWIVSVRIVDEYGDIYTDYIINGLEIIVENKDLYNISVVNISVGGPYSQALEIATRNTIDQGIVVIAPAGNSGVIENGPASYTYPAAYPWVLSVGAVDGFNNVTDYSSMGGPSSYDNKTVKPDLLAPGGGYSFLIYSSDSNDEPDFIDINGPLDPIDSDLDWYSGTSVSSAIVSGIAALVVNVFRSKQFNETTSLWDKLVQENGSWTVLLVKHILETSCYETYPLTRVYNGTDLSSYSPTLDRGLKDRHEGYGVIDGYSAVELANMVANYLLSHSRKQGGSIGNSWKWFLRNGVLYNPVEPPYTLNYPFNRSVGSIPYHFERYVLKLNGEAFVSKYGVRVIVSSVDSSYCDMDVGVYILDNSSWDPVLLNYSVNGFGVLDETIYIEPPYSEEAGDLLYTVVIRRATESSCGGEASLYVSPYLRLWYSGNGSLNIYSYSVSVNESRYALLMLLYSSDGNYSIYKYWVVKTMDYNGLKVINTSISISNLDPCLGWSIALMFTREPCTPYNLSNRVIVEGPILKHLDLDRVVDIHVNVSSRVIVYKNFTIRVWIKSFNNTPLPNATIDFYHSIDGVAWDLVGSNISDRNGFTCINTVVYSRGIHYYRVIYRSSYPWLGGVREFSIEAYLVTRVFLEVNKTAVYTVEPVFVNAYLVDNYTGRPISGEEVYVLVKSGETDWFVSSSGLTNANGVYSTNIVFMINGSYMLKALFNGSNTSYLLPSESPIISINACLTPTILSLNYSPVDLRVFDEIIFFVRLMYSIDGLYGYIGSASIELWMSNNSVWYLVDSSVTDRYGYTTLRYRFTCNGTYVFQVVYHGNRTFYNVSSSNIVVDVRSRYGSIELISYPSKAFVGQIIVIKTRLLDEDGYGLANRTLYLLKYVNGSWTTVASTITDEDGYAVFYVREFSVDLWSYIVYFPGEHGVYNSSYSRLFEINISWILFAVVVTPSVLHAYAGDSIDFLIQVVYNSTLIPYAPINVTVYRGEAVIAWYSVYTSERGCIVYSILFNYTGNYTVVAEYTGELDVDNRFSEPVHVIIKPIPIAVLVDFNETARATEPFIVKVKAYDLIHFTPLNNILVRLYRSVNGVDWYIVSINYTDREGSVVFQLVENACGVYYYRIEAVDPGVYTGLQKYGNADYVFNVTVYPIKTVIEVAISGFKAYVGEEVSIKVFLKTVNGRPVANAILELYEYVNGIWKLVNRSVTNSSGVVLFSVKSWVGDCIRQYRVVYNGSDIYYGVESSIISVTYLRIPTTIEFVYIKPSTIVVGGNIEAMVKLYSIKSLLINKNVELRVYYNNTLYTVAYTRTNNNGLALFRMKPVYNGTYILEAVFHGDNMYSSSSMLEAITVYPHIIIEFNVSCRILINGSIEYILIAKLSINNMSVSKEKILFYKLDPPKLIGYNYTDDNGVAVYRYISNSIYKGSFIAEYVYKNFITNSSSRKTLHCIWECPGIDTSIDQYISITSTITIISILITSIVILRKKFLK